MTYWTKEPGYVRRFRKGRAMIPRVCILCGEVWTPKPSDGDYEEACPKCREKLQGDAALDEIANTTNDGYDVTASTEPTVAVPVRTLEKWRKNLITTYNKDIPKELGPQMILGDVIYDIESLLSTSAENGPGGE